MNITMQRQDEVNKLLESLVEDISVSEAKYEEAKNSYESVGDWLSKDNSALKKYNPQIYVQGSFALGTAVTPIDKNDYDVDVVCLLETDNQTVTQHQLKELVGNRLKEHEVYKRMLVPINGGRRCWTLKYADARNFHIDILPAIPDDNIIFNCQTYRNEIDKHRIQITDNTSPDYALFSNNWHKSNPLGFLNWFKKEMEEKINLRSGEIKNFNESVNEIPVYKRKTTLQKVIQLLKRHRDKHYGNNEDKPISIIITTLATKAYNGEDTILDALQNIVNNMEIYIENRNGIYWVENPTNKYENFADKWESEPIKARNFFEWLLKVKNIVSDLLDEKINFAESIKNAYSYEIPDKKNLTPAYNVNKYVSNPIFNVDYREKPRWILKPSYSVNISATFRQNIHGDNIETYTSDGVFLPKNGSLQFKLKTDVPKPYETMLQVVNTGREAMLANNLRGKFCSTSYLDSECHREVTSYSGKHLIQFLVVKDGICVGISEEFIVNVK